MDTRGVIHHLTEEQSLEEAKRKIYFEDKLEGAKAKVLDKPMVPLTDMQMLFFKSRSSLFRETWARKMLRGLTQQETGWLENAIGEFLGHEKDSL